MMSHDHTSTETLDVGVLGSINQDTIEHSDGRIEHGLGGVMFTTCALCHLGGPNLRVWLLSRTSAEVAGQLRKHQQRLPGLRLDGLLQSEGSAYACHIVYDNRGGKVETLQGDVAPLAMAELSSFLPRLQALVVNFVTGFEIEIETLRTARKHFDGPILMDVHSLTLGRDGKGRRFPCRPAELEAWLSTADVVQMNEAEAYICGAPVPGSVASLMGWAETLLHHGPNLIVITRGDAGAIAVERTPDGFVQRMEQAPHVLSSEQKLDPTGCGDVFLAAMTAARIRSTDLSTALEYASRVAANNCILTGIDELHRLRIETHASTV
jgi:sugar/nucleoside kinase (ribokinase family)